jgi:hypothetical protein
LLLSLCLWGDVTHLCAGLYSKGIVCLMEAIGAQRLLAQEIEFALREARRDPVAEEWQ